MAWVDCQVLGNKRFLFGHWSLKTLRIGRRADSASANGLQKTYFLFTIFSKPSRLREDVVCAEDIAEENARRPKKSQVCFDFQVCLVLFTVVVFSN